jgi:hypothetical protein
VLVTRPEFETLIAAYVDRTIDELMLTLEEKDIAPADLAAIYRVGGASRTPLVGEKLEALHVPVRTLDDPKLVVALGASLTPDVAPAPPISAPPPPPPPPPPSEPKPEPVHTVADPVDPPEPDAAIHPLVQPDDVDSRDKQRDAEGTKNKPPQPRTDNPAVRASKPRKRRRKLWIGLTATALVAALAVTGVVMWRARSAEQARIAAAMLPELVDADIFKQAEVGSCIYWKADSLQPPVRIYPVVSPSCDPASTSGYLASNEAYKVAKRVSDPDECNLIPGEKWAHSDGTGVVLCLLDAGISPP